MITRQGSSPARDVAADFGERGKVGHRGLADHDHPAPEPPLEIVRKWVAGGEAGLCMSQRVMLRAVSLLGKHIAIWLAREPTTWWLAVPERGSVQATEHPDDERLPGAR